MMRSFLPIGLIALTIISIPSLHALGFSAAMPEVGRQFLDAKFAIGLTTSFSTGLALVAFFAAYAPKLCIGVLIFVHGAMIETTYYNRGYRRVNVSFKGFGKDAPKFNTFKELTENIAQSTKFDRSNARLSNFKIRKLNSILPVSSFHKYQYLLSSALGMVLFSIFYIGWIRAFLLLAFISLAAIGLLAYNYIGGGYIFDLKKSFWNRSREDTITQKDLLDVDFITTFFSVVALCSFCLGYLRFDFVAHSGDFSATVDSLGDLTIIGSTGSGIMAIDGITSALIFVPYDRLQSVQMK